MHRNVSHLGHASVERHHNPHARHNPIAREPVKLGDRQQDIAHIIFLTGGTLSYSPERLPADHGVNAHWNRSSRTVSTCGHHAKRHVL